MRAKQLFILSLLILSWRAESRAQTASDYVAQGRTDLTVSNLVGANLSFSNALVLSPTDPTGNALYAATRLLVLQRQPAVSNFLTRWGVPTTGRSLYDWTAALPKDTNGVLLAPAGVNADEATSLLRTNILGVIIAADANLAEITDTSFTLRLTAQETTSSAVTVDYGDIQLLRAMLEAAEYFIYNTYSWNLSAQLSVVRSFYANREFSVDGLLAEYPSLLTFASTNDLGNAETAFVNAAHHYAVASQFIRGRPPGTERLFNLDAKEDQHEQDFRLTLSDLASSLTNGQVTLEVNSNYSVFMPAAFAGTHTIRSFLPRLHGQGFVVGTFPDPTFGGVVTGFSDTDLDTRLSKYATPIPDILPAIGPGIQFPLHVIAGRGYVVQSSSDLVNWSTAAVLVASGNSYLFTDPAGYDQPHRFYRVLDTTGNMPPPANDNFAGSISLTGLGIQTTGYIENATAEPGEPGYGEPSVWWNWTAPSSGLVVASTAGSASYPSVNVYTGTTLDTLNLVDPVNDGNSYNGYAFMAYAGVTYQIQVTGYAFGNPGAIQLEIGPAPVLTVANPVAGVLLRSNITISASALSPDGITSIQYSTFEQFPPYNSSNGSSSGSTLDVTLTNVAPGTYYISETASDDLGISVSTNQTVEVDGMVVNGDFETGDFTGWTLSGDNSYTYVDFEGSQSGIYPYSGSYSAALGTSGAPGYLSQTLSTAAGGRYVISLAFANFDGDPGEFFVSWNGQKIFDNTNTTGLANFGWTNMQFTVSATGTSTVLQFGFQDDDDNFGLDDVTVTTAPPPPGSTGALRVTILPAGAVTAGAQWQVDGGTLHNNGAIATKLAPGTHNIAFKAVAGWMAPANQNVAISALATNVVTADYGDITKPTIFITTPTNGMTVTTPAFTVKGTAHDNVGATSVSFLLNGGGTQSASTSNNWANWSAVLGLPPGTNVVTAYSSDGAGNRSTNDNVSFFYLLRTPLTVSISGGKGTTSYTNGMPLAIGRSQTISATAAAGFKFTGWSGGTNSTNATIHFMMESNYALIANFADTNRPTATITSPTNGQVVTNFNLLVTGKASDNVGVTNVFCKTSGGTVVAQTTNNWTNWTATVPLATGSNAIQAWSVDGSGLNSRTNSITIVRQPVRTSFSVASGGSISQPQARMAFDGSNYLAAFQTQPAGSGVPTAQFVSQSGALIGSPMQAPVSGGADPPSVAFDGASYLMAWADYSQESQTGVPVRGVFISPAGSMGSPTQISQSATVQDFGTLVFGGGNYFLMWSDYRNTPTNSSKYDIFGAMFSPGGALTAADFEISSNAAPIGTAENSAAFDGTNFLATWSGASGGASVNGRLISPSGAFITDPFIIYTNHAIAAGNTFDHVAFDGSKYLVVFNPGVGAGSATNWHILGRFVTTTGMVLTNQISITADVGPQIVPCAAFDGKDYLITWNQGLNPFSATATTGTIRSRFLDVNGVPVAPEITLFTPSAGQTALWAPVLFDGIQFFSVGGLGQRIGASPNLKFANGSLRGAFISQ